MEQLKAAKEDDLYLSNVSPLGVPFNNLRNSSKDVQRNNRIKEGKLGSSCPKKFLALLPNPKNGKTICTASLKYQDAKIEELEAKKSELSEKEYQKEFTNITDKSCLCVGLGTTVMMLNDMDRKVEGDAVAICPGPNLAYYSKVKTLQEMVGHIYGKNNIIERTDRPNMFIKELSLYLDYLKTKVEETTGELNRKQIKYFSAFTGNMKDGIAYYVDLFNEMKDMSTSVKESILKELDESKAQLGLLILEIEKLKTA